MGKKDVYQMVTDKMIEKLESGVIPWAQPWGSVNGDKGAFNRVTKKSYSLLNQILLGRTGEWASFKQWEKLGGKIKKGEKASICVFWKMLEKTETNEDGEEVKKTIPLLRYYNVFHISQVDGVEPLEKPELNDNIEPIDNAEKVMREYIERSGVTFEESITDDACYIPARDTVSVPIKEQYENIEEYYSTNFHELVHSTGAKNRLDRNLFEDGMEGYSKEELVAEMGSAFILNSLGIDTEKSFENSTAYCKGWLETLKGDKKFIVSASSKAEKACKYILGETEEQEQGETEAEENVA